MTAQEHIMKELRELAEPVKRVDIGNTPLEEAIYARLMSKKFRKLKADEATVKLAKGAIKRAVADNKPVFVGVLFGGNKLWRFEEAPEVDWAELFNLIYYIKWMKTIASVYEHGAHLDYYSQDISVETLNNVPHEETDKYTETFRELLDWLKPNIPKGVKVTYRRHADEYNSRDEYLAEIEEGKKQVLAENGGNLPAMDEAQKLATELNVKLLPGQDADPQWREKVELEHQAIFKTRSLLPYLTDPTIIPVCPTFYPELIVTGSTKRSIAKFWAGVGALEQTGEGFNDLVLTPKQLENANFNWELVELDGLKGKNFHKIRVIT